MQEFYCNDLANNLKTNHLDITFQPTYHRHPHIISIPTRPGTRAGPIYMPSNAVGTQAKRAAWEPVLHIERLVEQPRATQRIRIDYPPPFKMPAARSPALSLVPTLDTQPALVPTLDTQPALVPTLDTPAAEPTAPAGAKKPRKPRAVEGSLLRADGSSESSGVTMLA